MYKVNKYKMFTFYIAWCFFRNEKETYWWFNSYILDSI